MIAAPSGVVFKCADSLQLAGLGNTASHSLGFLTPAWPSASDSQGDGHRNRI